ncbi:phage major capsid protein [Arthrobacter sp. B10-11]|uniref:phage major capsid protein n=1 Tax=Arthrobacter sp. B10-11 TaxID=3081160 RepID=UPI002953F0F3|nr:phage major capsid protein [Arthrobacter sp. B10-11]MDV8146260.1 phage major capsid protein [Arthrobacter sp. B10-11]
MNNMARMLVESRNRLHEQGKALIERAERENRSLSAEEERQFNQIGEEMESLRQRSDQLVQFQADAQQAEDALRGIGLRGPGADDGGEVTAAFRQIANGERRSFELTATRAETRLLTEYRALSKGTASAGGNAVPTSMLSKLYEHLIETATLVRAGATVFNTDSGANMDIPVTTAHGTAALVAEAGTIGQSDPTFAKRTLGAYKYADLIIVSNELLTDSGVDMEGYLARMAGRAVGNALGAHLVTGTGGGTQPTGILTSATSGATSPTGTVGAPSFDTLSDLYYSVIAPYRNSPEAGWLVKDTTVAGLRKLKDTTGRYLWEPSIIAGQPDTIFGKPVYTDPNVPATGLNAKSVIFGDLSTYMVRLVNNVRFERSDDFKFDSDQAAFRCIIRGDGILADQTGAVKFAVGAAT